MLASETNALISVSQAHDRAKHLFDQLTSKTPGLAARLELARQVGIPDDVFLALSYSLNPTLLPPSRTPIPVSVQSPTQHQGAGVNSSVAHQQGGGVNSSVASEVSGATVAPAAPKISPKVSGTTVAPAAPKLSPTTTSSRKPGVISAGIGRASATVTSESTQRPFEKASTRAASSNQTQSEVSTPPNSSQSNHAVHVPPNSAKRVDAVSGARKRKRRTPAPLSPDFVKSVEGALGSRKRKRRTPTPLSPNSSKSVGGSSGARKRKKRARTPLLPPHQPEKQPRKDEAPVGPPTATASEVGHVAVPTPPRPIESATVDVAASSNSTRQFTKRNRPPPPPPPPPPPRGPTHKDDASMGPPPLKVHRTPSQPSASRDRSARAASPSLTRVFMTLGSPRFPSSLPSPMLESSELSALQDALQESATLRSFARNFGPHPPPRGYSQVPQVANDPIVPRKRTLNNLCQVEDAQDKKYKLRRTMARESLSQSSSSSRDSHSSHNDHAQDGVSSQQFSRSRSGSSNHAAPILGTNGAGVGNVRDDDDSLVPTQIESDPNAQPEPSYCAFWSCFLGVKGGLEL